MARRADIDLLFGLLALQNGLIEQGTLFAAFAAWVREKDRAMADILVGLGALDAGERALLEGLVQKNLQRHGGNSSESLASLSSIDAVREEISRIGDPALAASLPASPRAPKAENEPFSTVASPSVGTLTSEGARFRILRPHATGGLGQVFVACDTELNREVALKEIRERYADEQRHRARFEYEAEITGGLEHPGVVPVYGLGRHADGRPYYAMRFIRGVTLKAAIAEFHDGARTRRNTSERGLDLRKLLRRFLDVCNTMEYAHQRGVVHRDIKPNNVMLGNHGETMVVDWGLAKAVGRPASDTPLDERTLAPELSSGSSETLPGSAVGTPAYMSPEQAAGDLGRIGPQSDVYSLGATLYSLLTGKPPFEDEDQGQVLQLVQQGKFAAPHKLDRSVDPGLEAICLKAMSLAPTNRYPSARALADDVERWMADESIAARRDPLSARAARWMRRHRTVASGIAVFLVVAASASSIATWLINGQKAEADRQRRQAEGNLAQARQVVDEMYTRVASQLEDIPRMDDYQRTILERARDFYEREALPQNQAFDTRLAAASTQLRLAYIHRKLGGLDKARGIARRSLELYESLIRDDPAGIEQRVGVGEALASLGGIAAQARDFPGAADQFRRAIEWREELVRSFSADQKHSLDLGITWRELGQVLLHSHRLTEADSACGNALRLLEGLAAERPEDQICRAALAAALDDLANLYTEQNRDPESESLRRRALEIRRAAIESHPGDLRARCEVASGLNNLGYTLTRLGKTAEAAAAVQDSIAYCERILTEHPDLPANQIGFSMALSHLAELLILGGRADEGLACYRRALNILRGGSPDRSPSPELQARLAAQLYELALAEYNQRRTGDASVHVRESLQDCETISKEHSRDPAILDLRGQAWHLVGLIARDGGGFDEAVSSFRRAVELHEAVLGESPNEPQIQGHLVSALVEGLGKTYRGLGRMNEARASYRRAANLLEAMDRKDPADFYNLACCLAQCSAPADDEQEPNSLQDADRAMEALRRALAAGVCDLTYVQGDTDLDPIKGRADFQAMAMDLAFPADPFAD
jgi:serine/threonine-protein kinase